MSYVEHAAHRGLGSTSLLRLCSSEERGGVSTVPQCLQASRKRELPARMPCRCSLSDIRGTHLPETWQLRFGESCQGALRPRVDGRLEQWGWVLWLGASAGQWRRSEHGERTMLCVVRQHGQAGTWQ